MIKESDLNTYTEILNAYIKRSTCARVQVAAILVKDGRINMTGWNGVPIGFNHCYDFFKSNNIDIKSEEGRSKHRLFSERFELHGEMNVLAQCAKHGIITDGASLVQQVSPCLSCAKLIISSGIKSVYFREYYDRNDDNGISIMILSNIKVFKINNKNSVDDELCTQILLEDVYNPLIIDEFVYNPLSNHD